MESATKPATIVAQNEGQGLSVAGDSYRVIIGGKQTGNAFAVIEMLVPPGGGPVPHSHTGINETFYILEGELEFKTEAGAYTVGKGAFVEIPLNGPVHCFKNKTASVAHMICTVMPAGMDGFFTEIGQAAEFGKFLPPPQMDESMKKKMDEIAVAYGQKVFPPDYLD